MRALIGKKLESYKLAWGYMGKPWWSWGYWALNSDEFSLPVEVAPSLPVVVLPHRPPRPHSCSQWYLPVFLHWSEGINPALIEETVMASSEAAAMQNNAESPQDPPPPHIFASRPITRLKSQQFPKSEMQCVTHEEVHYTLRQLLEFSDI